MKLQMMKAVITKIVKNIYSEDINIEDESKEVENIEDENDDVMESCDNESDNCNVTGDIDIDE